MPADRKELYDPIPLAPYQEWMKRSGLLGNDPAFAYQPTMELRWRGKVLEQKWVLSQMAYAHKWVPVRKKLKGENR